jgi:streptogramin lyase
MTSLTTSPFLGARRPVCGRIDFGFLFAALTLPFALNLPGQSAVEVFAGTGTAGSTGDGGPARLAQVNQPFGLARARDGALWFADYEAHQVRRIARDGIISTVVGTGRQAYTGDGGPALNASLNNPHEVQFDHEGNLYIADAGNNAIRRLDAKSGLLTTFAGTGKPGYSGDNGPASSARLNSPISLQFSPQGDLFIADIGNHVIRRVNPKTGIIATFAGSGHAGPTPDGSSIAGTPLNGPRSLDFDASGNLWLVTREGNQVLKFDLAAQIIHLIAGTGRKGFTGDGGPALNATFAGPKNVAAAPNGDVYVADTDNDAIRRLNLKLGTVELVAGGTQPLARALGEGESSLKLHHPHGVLVDSDGTVYISDSANHRILVLKPATTAH